MKVIIDVLNLTKDQHKTLKTYSHSAMDFIDRIKNIDETKPIEHIGFYLKRIEQALEYIRNIVDNIEPSDD